MNDEDEYEDVKPLFRPGPPLRHDYTFVCNM